MKRCTLPSPWLTEPSGPALPAPGIVDAVPAATGSSIVHWGSLHDAWQDAVDARPGRPSVQGKEPLPHGVLLAVTVHRLRAIPMLRQALERDPGFRQRIDAPQWHTRDAQGRNWDIPALTGAPSQPAAYEADLRRVVDAMRDQFDLA
jgi:hypothetical protein